MKFVVTSAFGVEKVVKTELIRLGFSNLQVENGAIIVEAPAAAMPVLNVHLRCAERVFILVAERQVKQFDDLFDFVNSLPWENYLTKDSAFPVLAKSKKSALFSLSDIQRLSKKAIVKRLSSYYGADWFSEKGGKLAIHVNIDSDQVRLLIDTSGVGLHKRGYRAKANQAPLKETLAAALVLLSDWRGKHLLVDPMCGSGTIAIEAALIVRNIAPGLQRKFAFENLKNFDAKQYKQVRQAAYSAIDYDKDVLIKASDIDAKAIAVARQNAEHAGVDGDIVFKTVDFNKLKLSDQRQTIICNPPYGERLSDSASALKLYRQLGQKIANLTRASYYFLTAHDGFESAFAKPASRKRKLYNGKIRCNYYQYRCMNDNKKRSL